MPSIRVRARALDMLGRQQIAGVPTAISEIFKNAHDAYAHNVEVDFLRHSRLLVVRDDGMGMSHRDFLDRWLTLGTESKLGAETDANLPRPDPNQDPRPILGEKGIGRLAIAAIGPQTLVLTRAKLSADTDQLVVAFIHWGVFSLPGVDLADIQIPVLPLPGGMLPSGANVATLVAQMRTNLENIAVSLPKSTTASTLATIFDELDHFEVVPSDLYNTLPKGPTLDGEGHGTHFIILPTEEILSDDIDGHSTDDIAPPLIKMLIGFTNTMTSSGTNPVIQARFRDHKGDGFFSERIAGSEFFTPNEFKQADHHISGNFDKYGQFRGSVQVYGEKPRQYILPWTEARGEPLLCGPFKIEFAYVQGEARHTKLPPEDHARLVAKLGRIGGLYIYRDGIRILPYGNSDYDFLNIEQRRTKSASYYFFSYRRLFGVIEITRKGNPNLTEKAGREGFRENRAYRELKRLLENFFIQLAAEFFREGGIHATEFMTTRADLERKENLRRKRAKKVHSRRKEFKKRLDTFFDSVNMRRPEAEVNDVLKAAEEKLARLAEQSRPVDLLQQLLDLEGQARAELIHIDDTYKRPRARNFGLTRQIQHDWEAYQLERKRLETEVFHPASKRLADIVSSQYAAPEQSDIDHRRHLDRTLENFIQLHRKRMGASERMTAEALEKARLRVIDLTRARMEAFDTAIRETVMEYQQTDTTSLDLDGFGRLRDKLESRIDARANLEIANLAKLQEQLQSVGTEDGLEQAEITDALEEELEVLRERDIAGLHLAQIGMTLGIIQHEFVSTVLGIRNGIRRLKPWADANESLKPIYSGIRSSFEHIDGYLRLFTPLDRRLHRRKTQINGRDIYQFLFDLFEARLKQHQIQFNATERFHQMTVFAFPSSFYPCFVNLIDNAIFWVASRQSDSERSIELDIDGADFTITDSGPGIPSRDTNAIFEMGFTRRPGGRGMGLYLARQILRKVGYELTLDSSESGRGARFRIRSATQVDSNDVDTTHSQYKEDGFEADKNQPNV